MIIEPAISDNIITSLAEPLRNRSGFALAAESLIAGIFTLFNVAYCYKPGFSLQSHPRWSYSV